MTSIGENIFKTAQCHDNSAIEEKSRSGQFFRSTKTYGHEEGLSCCFRQWRAHHSHCGFIHGYALAFTFVFIARELDPHGWCMDFGGLKKARQWLHETFDHKLIAAHDDPGLAMLKTLDKAGLCQLRILPAVGCEAFAWYSWRHIDKLVYEMTNGRVRVESVRVQEHAGNGAKYCINHALEHENARETGLFS